MTQDTNSVVNPTRRVISRTREFVIGVLIIAAYGVVISAVISNIPVIIVVEIICGLTVVGAAVLYLPILKPSSQPLTYTYIAIKIFEGLAIIVGAIFLVTVIDESDSLSAVTDERDVVYLVIGYLFGIRFFILNIIFYQSRILPRWFAIWGLVASALLFVGVIVDTINPSETVIGLVNIPVILNELTLAVLLIVKGFSYPYGYFDDKIKVVGD